MDQGIEMEQITSTVVSDEDRDTFIFKALGAAFINFENQVFITAESYTEYRGGYWNFYRLSNGGIYMAPDSERTWRFRNPNNWSDEVMSSEALGIACCLYAFSYLSFHYPQAGDQYHLLYAFALEHPEANAIFAAID